MIHCSDKMIYQTETNPLMWTYLISMSYLHVKEMFCYRCFIIAHSIVVGHTRIGHVMFLVIKEIVVLIVLSSLQIQTKSYSGEIIT